MSKQGNSVVSSIVQCYDLEDVSRVLLALREQSNGNPTKGEGNVLPSNLHIQGDEMLHHCRKDLASEWSSFWQLSNQQDGSQVGALHAARENLVWQASCQDGQKQAAGDGHQLQYLQAMHDFMKASGNLFCAPHVEIAEGGCFSFRDLTCFMSLIAL